MVNFSLSALGMVNSLGTDIQTIWKGILAGDQSHLMAWSNQKGDKSTLVGKVPLEDSKEVFPRSLSDFQCRNNVFILKTYGQIEPVVKDRIRQFGPDRIGVVMGSSTSGVASTESAVAHHMKTGLFPTDFRYIQHELGGASEFLARLAGIRGPSYTLSTACSSSAKAFASARALIRDGWCDAVLVGGADSLCNLTIEGFLALESLSTDPANSMSRNRRGFNIGEGAALFLMERSSDASGIHLLGVGESSDAYHMSAPSPNGTGALSCMKRALSDAGLSPGEIDYINLHGTGTLLNDSMEALSVSHLFANVPASTTKGVTGHTLGAAGAMEVGVCWLSLKFQEPVGVVHLPPHCWDGQIDSDFPKLNIVSPGMRLNKSSKKRLLLSNSFGFGGSNCSIIIGALSHER